MTRELSDDLLNVFDTTVDAMLIADREGRILRVNSALTHLFGLPPDSTATLEVNDLVPEDLRAHHARHMAAYRQAPEARPMAERPPLRAKRHDGAEFPAEISLSPLSEGRVLATVHDISARVEAEARSRRWSERYASLLGAIPDIIVELDGNNVLQWGNAAAHDFFGADLVGQPMTRYHADDAPPLMADCAACEGWFLCANGERRMLSWCCHHLTEVDGSAGGLICSARDVTERHRSEDTLRTLRRQMRQVHGLQVAGQTTRKIAHDLNQPLNAVSAYATAALRLSSDEPPDAARLRTALEGCCEEADRAGDVMRKLMTFLDRSALEAKPVDVARAVRSVVQLCQADGYGDTRFDIDIAPGLWQAMGNPRQIDGVLHSLITNSVEALRLAGVPSPSIRIEGRNDNEHGLVEITLSDNGPGLDRGTEQQAFSPFFTTKQQAVGLGLTISRALIEAGGGELWYDDEIAPGATFRFTLPVKQ